MPVISQLEIHSLTYVLPAICILVTPPPKEKDFIEPGGEHMKATKSKQRNTGASEKGWGLGSVLGVETLSSTSRRPLNNKRKDPEVSC